MSAPLRVGVFVAGLGVVFLAAAGVGRAVGPIGAADPAPVHGGGQPDHAGEMPTLHGVTGDDGR